MVGSIEKSTAEAIFQEQPVWTTAKSSVLYDYRRKIRHTQPSLFQLMYGFVLIMNSDETFPMVGIPAGLSCQNLEMESTLFLSVSGSKRKSKQLIWREAPPEWRFEVGNKMLVKGKALDAVKTSAFQSE